MVEPKKVSVSDAMNVFVIGSLGAGKSTILSTLFYPTYEESIGAEDFKPSKSLEGFTQVFTQKFSPELKCNITDSPGLGDKQIPMNTWLINYNAQFGQNSRIDLCIVVLEKAERIDTNVVLAFQLLDLTISGLKSDHLCIIFNKADEDEDSFESVLEYYKSAWKQAECEHMPTAAELSEDNILILHKQKMGSKMKPLEECKKEATALFIYAQAKIGEFIVKRLLSVQAVGFIQVEEKTFDQLVEKTQDEMLLKALEEGKKYYEENMKKMNEMMDNQAQQIQQMAEQNQKAIEDAKEAAKEAIALQERMAQEHRQDKKEAQEASDKKETLMMEKFDQLKKDGDRKEEQYRKDAERKEEERRKEAKEARDDNQRMMRQMNDRPSQSSAPSGGAGPRGGPISSLVRGLSFGIL